MIANGANPVLDRSKAVKTIAGDTNRWVSFDNEKTTIMKLSYAFSGYLEITVVRATTVDESKDAALNLIQIAIVEHSNIKTVVLL